MLTFFIDKIADKVRWGYLTAFVLLLVSYILTFYSSQQVLNQQKSVNHTTQVINTIDDLTSELKDAESSLRGYLLSKNDRFLVDYNYALRMIDSTFLNSKTLTADNEVQQKRLDTLHDMIGIKINIMATGMRMFNHSNNFPPDSMTWLGNKSKKIMDDIKAITLKLQNEENRLMTLRSNRVSTLSNFIMVINVASIVIAIVLAFYSITTFNKENKAKQAADKQAEAFRYQLEERINELKKLNTELVELRSIEKFAATGRISRTIAHEVRNPLTNINLATEHMRSELPPSEETSMLLDMIARNSNRINDLISDLLNSTKATQLNFTRININDLLDQSIAFAQDRIDLKGIKVKKEYGNNLRPVLVDVEKMNIAFLNIIVNAIEATEPKTGEIRISSKDDNNRCVVTISDNGKGMDKESLAKLFEPYFTTKEKGTGLGLTNTQNIILSHQGNIHAESEPGSGSSFIISFNYAEA
jgi:signal transduction histidine kinase